MATSNLASHNHVQPPRTARDPRVAAAVQAVSVAAFPPLVDGWREMPTDAMARVLEDLQVAGGSRVLVVEPFSGYVPELLGRLGGEVVVISADPARAEMLRTQLADVGAANVRVETFLQDRADDESGFDRMVVMQPANEELGPVLQGLLANHGRAVWSVDKSMPPRRVRRLLRVDETTTIEEDLDLVDLMPLLGDMLVDAGVALRQEVRDAVVSAREQGCLLGEELLARGSVREADLYRVLAEQQGRGFVEAADVLARLDVDLVRQLPRKYLDYHAFLPVCAEQGKVWIVTPSINLSLDEVQSVFEDAELVWDLVSPADLERIWSVLELGLASRAAMGSLGGAPRGGGASLVRAPQPAEVVASSLDVAGRPAAGGLLEELLLAAVARRAGSIHLDEVGESVRVRHRIDGVLRLDREQQLDGRDLAGLLAEVGKVGDAEWQAGGRSFHVRSSVREGVEGASLTLHLNDWSQEPPLLEDLGLGAEACAGVREALDAARGLVLIAGPLHSGRSLTMRAICAEVGQDERRKLLSVDATHCAGKSDAEVAELVAELERHDADVLCLDVDAGDLTMQAAVRAAHRGRLVLVSASGNDAADAMQGLAEHGLTGNSIAGSLGAVLVQHLVPRLCSACRAEHEPPREQLEDAFPAGLPHGSSCYASDGGGEEAACEACAGVGTDGSVPVIEFLPATPSLRRALRSNVAPHSFGATSRQNGLLSLRSSALRLMADGEVSFASVRHLLVEQ